MKSIILTVGLLLLALTASLERALCDSSDLRPKVIVQPVVEIKGSKLTLGEIAKIVVPSIEQEELRSRLVGIDLGDAPPPLSEISLIGEQVLQAIEKAGIDRQSIGYSVPKAIRVRRQGRPITPDEVLMHAREAISGDPQLDLQVREVQWSTSQVIPIGSTRITAERLGMPQGGKLPLRVEAYVDDQPVARFFASAIVDDWREVPVIKSNVARGMLIGPENLQLVRLNLNKYPADVIDSYESVLGKRAKMALPAGEVVRRTMVDIPPLVPTGKLVSIIVVSGPLRATASGIALEDGFDGSTIRVKNERSGKVVRAEVISESEVEVKIQ